MRRAVGRAFLSMCRLVERARAKAFSVLAGGAFASFGKRSVVQPPVRLSGAGRIAIGDDVFVGSGSWLQALDDGDNQSVAVVIGSGTKISGTCVLSGVRSVILGENVLLARNVYISDHSHSYRDTARPVHEQGLDKVAPVRIGDGAWLGQNVVVTPGVSIGRGAVVGANSVVLDDLPEFSVAVGSPARVVKRFGPAQPVAPESGVVPAGGSAGRSPGAAP